MEFSIDKFLPGPGLLILNDVELEFNLITLEVEVWAIENYGSYDALLTSINEDPSNLITFSWRLLKNKSFFNYRPNEFMRFLNKAGLVESSAKLSNLIFNLQKKSNIQVKNSKRYKELLEVRNKENENKKPCYASYFDFLSSRMSLTLSEFKSLTLGQIHALMDAGQSGKHKDLEVQAALSNKKIKDQIKYEDFSEDEENENEQEAKEFLKRMQENYEKGKSNE